jgi:hypothetical protein
MERLKKKFIVTSFMEGSKGFGYTKKTSFNQSCIGKYVVISPHGHGVSCSGLLARIDGEQGILNPHVDNDYGNTKEGPTLTLINGEQGVGLENAIITEKTKEDLINYCKSNNLKKKMGNGNSED